MTDPESPRKASFIRALVAAGINWRGITELARDASVEPELIFEMISGDPVPIKEAEKVLVALGLRTGVQWSVETMNINVCEESNDSKQSE